MASIFDPNNTTAFNLLGNQQQQPFTISQENYQQPNTNANASGMNRNQRIGFMLAALSDAFAGRDVAGRAMGRAQIIRQQAEAERQRQKALEQEKLIKSLGADLPPNMRILAQMFPQVYAASQFREPKLPSASEQLKRMELEVLKTLEGYEGSFEERVARLEKEQPAKYGIYKDSIEKSEAFNFLQEFFENQFGTKSNKSNKSKAGTVDLGSLE
tara:strand:+ start:150 stop:791 length:642 start_codon:yes stop_codon:yes gene_type:complete